MENEFRAELKWDAGDWCVILHEGIRYYLGWKHQTAFVVDASGCNPVSHSLEEIPEEVQKEFMLWRLSR